MFELGKEDGWTFCELVDASAIIPILARLILHFLDGGPECWMADLTRVYVFKCSRQEERHPNGS